MIQWFPNYEALKMFSSLALLICLCCGLYGNSAGGLQAPGRQRMGCLLDPSTANAEKHVWHTLDDCLQEKEEEKGGMRWVREGKMTRERDQWSKEGKEGGKDRKWKRKMKTQWMQQGRKAQVKAKNDKQCLNTLLPNLSKCLQNRDSVAPCEQIWRHNLSIVLCLL